MRFIPVNMVLWKWFWYTNVINFLISHDAIFWKLCYIFAELFNEKQFKNNIL